MDLLDLQDYYHYSDNIRKIRKKFIYVKEFSWEQYNRYRLKIKIKICISPSFIFLSKKQITRNYPLHRRKSSFIITDHRRKNSPNYISNYQCSSAKIISFKNETNNEVNRIFHFFAWKRKKKIRSQILKEKKSRKKQIIFSKLCIKSYISWEQYNQYRLRIKGIKIKVKIKEK